MLKKRQIIWRYALSAGEYGGCRPIKLGSGLFISSDQKVHQIQSAVYQADCYTGSPMLSASKKLRFQYLPIIVSTWESYLDSTYGSFRYSIFPVIFSITSSAVITWFLTLIVYTNHTSKPSLLLKLSTLLASIYLMMIFCKSIVILKEQQMFGRLSGFELLSAIAGNTSFNVIDLLAVLFLQLNQVQIIMRLFSRQNEKRVAFLFGVTVSIISQVIWGVSTFAKFDNDDNESISIMPAFIYLLRIAMSVMYSALVAIYTGTKLTFAFRRQVLLLTILNLIAVNVSIGFFISDVANLWVSELSDIFNVTTYVLATVIPWEWINKIHQLERIKEKEGILGRRFYEDESNKIDRYGLFVEVNADSLHSSSSSSQHDELSGIGTNKMNHGTYNDGVQRSVLDEPSDKKIEKLHESKGTTFMGNKLHGVKSKLQHTTHTLLDLTDKIIAIGLAVPRSVSSASRDFDMSPRKQPTQENRVPRTRAPRKDVFLYTRKEVRYFDENDEMNEGSSRDV